MKIIFVSSWFSAKMGYIENQLPAAVAQLGHEVHLVTSTANVYFNQAMYQQTYQKILGAPTVEAGTYTEGGVIIHRLPFSMLHKKLIINGLKEKIATLKPDIVHAWEHATINTLQIVQQKRETPFRLFSGNHDSYLALFTTPKERRRLSKWLLLAIQKPLGWFISKHIELCFCVTSDAGEVAATYYGVPRNKIKVTTLGVETAIFKPDDAKRQAMRKQLGIKPDEIFCLFTGKFDPITKQPTILAKATAILTEKGLPIRTIFVGEGALRAELNTYQGCSVLPFVPHTELPSYYVAADLAVYPFGETASQLDAAASGACLVLGDCVQAYDLVEKNDPIFDETGVYKPKIVSRFYHYPDPLSLADVIAGLASSAELRQKLSDLGKKEVETFFSWNAIAKRRVEDYKKSLES